VKLVRLTFATIIMAGVGGCYMEPFSEPIPIRASYSPRATAPITLRPEVAIAPMTAPSVSQPATVPALIDEATRDKIVAAARGDIQRRFGVEKRPQLTEYFTLVGSLLTINTLTPNAEYEYVVLSTDQPISAALWPKTICISRGLLHQMEDESELAGVLAREISNLTSGRGLKAAGLPSPPLPGVPTTRPSTQAAATASVSSAQNALIQLRAAKVADLLTKEGLGLEMEETADVEGARLAAAARYAPDGFLRLLTRQKPAGSATTNASAGWERVKALDANVLIISKAFPHADVKLPARFEGYLKSADR
jgi:predicted Zn-dependent protease